MPCRTAHIDFENNEGNSVLGNYTIYYNDGNVIGNNIYWVIFVYESDDLERPIYQNIERNYREEENPNFEGNVSYYLFGNFLLIKKIIHDWDGNENHEYTIELLLVDLMNTTRIDGTSYDFTETEIFREVIENPTNPPTIEVQRGENSFIFSYYKLETVKKAQIHRIRLVNNTTVIENLWTVEEINVSDSFALFAEYDLREIRIFYGSDDNDYLSTVYDESQPLCVTEGSCIEQSFETPIIEIEGVIITQSENNERIGIGELDFGLVKVDEHHTKTITISNTGEGRLRISIRAGYDQTLPFRWFDVRGQYLDPDDTYEHEITFYPREDIETTYPMSIQTNSCNYDEIEITLKGIGGLPDLEIYKTRIFYDESSENYILRIGVKNIGNYSNSPVLLRIQLLDYSQYGEYVDIDEQLYLESRELSIITPPEIIRRGIEAFPTFPTERPLERQLIESIEANEVKTLIFRTKKELVPAYESYLLVCTIDPFGQIKESNKANNVKKYLIRL